MKRLLELFKDPAFQVTVGCIVSVYLLFFAFAYYLSTHG